MLLTISDFFTSCSHSAIAKPIFFPNVIAKVTLNHPGSLHFVHCCAHFTEIFVAKYFSPSSNSELKA